MTRFEIQKKCRQLLAELPSIFTQEQAQRAVLERGLDYQNLKIEIDRAKTLGKIRMTPENDFEKV